jgi:hypothetical protein
MPGPDRWRSAAVSAAGWAIGAGATIAGVLLFVVLGYRGRREHRAALLGVATGATFGLNSSLIAGVGAAARNRGRPLTLVQRRRSTFAVAYTPAATTVAAPALAIRA